jgi:NitT/TauT family transport system permease protein
MSHTAETMLDVPRLPKAATSPGVQLTVLRRILLPTLVAVILIAAWQAAIVLTNFPRVIVPPPSDIALSIIRNRGTLLANSWPTILTAVEGFLISTVLGAVLAVGVVSFRLLRDALFPSLVAFQIIPKIALAPIFVIWLGTGIESRLAFTVFISFFSVLIATADGLETVEKSLLKLCRSLNATRLRVLIHVQLPTAIPFLLAGMKIAITMAMIGTIIGEFISSRAGLGYLILTAAGRLDTNLIMASIAVLCAWGLLLYGAIELFERTVTRWIGR